MLAVVSEMVTPSMAVSGKRPTTLKDRISRIRNDIQSETFQSRAIMTPAPDARVQRVREDEHICSIQ